MENQAQETLPLNLTLHYVLSDFNVLQSIRWVSAQAKLALQNALETYDELKEETVHIFKDALCNAINEVLQHQEAEHEKPEHEQDKNLLGITFLTIDGAKEPESTVPTKRALGDKKIHEKVAEFAKKVSTKTAKPADNAKMKERTSDPEAKVKTKVAGTGVRMKEKVAKVK